MWNFRQWTILHLSLFVTFIVSGLAINVVQTIFYLLIGWWNRSLFRKINYYFVWMLYAQILFIADWWSASEVRIHARPEVLRRIGAENAIVVMNHHFELDWCFGWMVADRFGVLGNARVFVKKVLKYVPIIGWAWNFSDVAYLERNWDKDREVMTRSLCSLADYPDPVWLLIFAEGTRINPEKLEASRQFARDRGLPIMQHCLVPRTKGFVHAIQTVDRSKVSHVYDVTLAVNTDAGGPATLSSILFGRKTVGECFVRDFPVAEIPRDAEGAAKFLVDLYAAKDELIGHYKLTGSFPETGGVAVSAPPRRVWSLVNTVVLNATVMPSVMALIGTMAFSGSECQLITALTLVVGMYAMLRKFIGLTKISKSSSYGEKKD